MQAWDILNLETVKLIKCLIKLYLKNAHDKKNLVIVEKVKNVHFLFYNAQIHHKTCELTIWHFCY